MPLTSTCDQFRVRVTTWLPARNCARVLAGVATTFAGLEPFAWIEAASRVSSMYERPSWVTVGRGGTAQPAEASRSTIRAPVRNLALIGSQF